MGRLPGGSPGSVRQHDGRAVGQRELYQEGRGVAAKYIFAGLAVLFIVMGIVRGGPSHPQSRTWLLIGVIFSAVSAWLFYQG